MSEYRVQKDDEGVRLDQFVALQAALSRSRVQAMIRQGEVWIDAGNAKANYRLKEGDLIRWQITEACSEKPEAEDISLELLYEDEALFIINKPPGLVVHPAPGHTGGTLLNGLLHYDQNLACVERAGLVHRLDKDTSGALVVARSAEVQAALMKKFKAREVTKRYVALVRGVPPAQLCIKNRLGRDPRNRKRQAVLLEGGREAHTIVSRIESFGQSARVEVDIKTGRTHQIRVHLSDAGYPIIGDALYGGKQRLSIEAARQMLHAAYLSFIHPLNGKELSCRATLPVDMQEVIDQLRVGHG